jgi:Uma2 family endonuclease
MLRDVKSGPAPAWKRPTYEDLERLPPHVVGEIIAGELVVSPRPAPRHARAGSGLGGVLAPPFDHGIGGPGGWWILYEPELHLGVDPDYEAVVPDCAGWRVERMPELPDTAWFAVVPDWVCEIVSPATAAIDRAEKLPFYARAGVAHAWVVDPGVRTLEVYRRCGAAWLLVGTWRGDAAVRAEPFDAVEFRLGLLWGRPQGPTP